MNKLIIAIALGALHIAPAFAAPVTLSCNIVSSSDDTNSFTDVNQVIVDVAANSVDLRIAQTMGTNNPTNWFFQTHTDALGTETFSIQQTRKFTYGAGLYGNAAHSFALSDAGVLSWVFLWEGKLTTFKWQCTK